MSAANVFPSPLKKSFVLPHRKGSLTDGFRRAICYKGQRLFNVGILVVCLAGFVSHAAADNFPAQLELSSLAAGDGSIGFVVNGANSGDCSGVSVGPAGDVNGDGIDDLVIGARDASPGGRIGAGESYVVFGRTSGFASEFELSSLAIGDGSTGFVLHGIDAADKSGESVSAAGDVNGDGVDDLIIGARTASPGGRSAAGESYVLFGSATGFDAVIELSDLAMGDGSKGFVINGDDSSDTSGTSVSAAGDVNGDGVGDLIIGARYADPGERDSAGESYVVFGRDTGFEAEFELSTLATGDGSKGFVMYGIDQYDDSGELVSAAGDVNGDGLDDIIICASDADPGGRGGAGESYVVFGRDKSFPAQIELSSLAGGDGSTGFVLNGFYYADESCSSASEAGDVNGDGIDDLIIGARLADPSGRYHAGESYVVFGRNTGFPAEFELLSLAQGDGSTGFLLNGVDEFDRSGSLVSAAGDVNGDGLDDLIVGAHEANPSGIELAGKSYLVFGRDTGFPAEFELSSLAVGDGSSGFLMNGIDEYDRSGRSGGRAGDVNGDGIDDFIIGAPFADPGERSSAGESYVLFGRAINIDSDGDGVSDNVDNCTLIANADQRDTDNDGYGNICDPDLDNDGIVNFADLFLFAEHFLGSDEDTDFNNDGATNFLDFAILSEFFLLAPGPSAIGQ